MISDTETTVYGPGAYNPGELRVRVEIHDPRFLRPLALYFASLADDAPLVGFELGDSEKPWSEIDLSEAALVAKNLALYTALSRAVIMLEGQDTKRALDALNKLGSTRRGLPGPFLRAIAEEYRARRSAGEPAPIKAIAAAHDVTISSASRWVKEARRRGWVEEAEA